MADTDPVLYATPIRVLIGQAPFPTDFITGEGGLLDPLLDRLFYTDVAPAVDQESFGALVDLVVVDEAALVLPGLEDFQIVLGGDPSGLTRVRAGFRVSARGVSFSLGGVTAALRFPREVLKPVTETGADAPGFAQIEVRGSFLLDESFDLHVVGFDALQLRPCMIGNSGIVIEADDVKLDLSRSGSIAEVIEAGFDESFLGIFIGKARVQLPEGLPNLAPEDLVLQNCAIGSGGVSGRLSAEYDDPSFDPVTKQYQGRGAGDFFGVPFGLKRAAIELKQTALVEGTLAGQLLLPFFDKRVNVAIGLNLDGGFSAEIAGAPELGDGYDEHTGLLTLEKSRVMKLVVQSLRFEVRDGVLWTKLSGRITPLIGDVEWPTFEVTELAIDSHGNVAVDGGWLNLPTQPSFSFHGFQMEVTKLGFGNASDGGHWLGLSGGVKLVDEITAGASVEGLRLTWYPDGRTDISFEGIGVEFAVPKVLHFAGKVAFKAPQPPAQEPGFVGAVQVQLPALNLEISGSLRFGRHVGGSYMALYLSTDLPTGIPLWATGLGLYGFAGLFGKDMEPDRLEDEEWYEGWFKRPTEGVTDLATKWRPAAGSLALGAGASIGTLADNGYAFCSRVLFAIVFPGPIILVEGRANLFKERAKLSDAEPIFRALGVIDMRADTITLGLDAHYKYNEDGRLIAVSGSAEAFFDKGDAGAWHVYLGQDEPRSKRIRAEVFKLYTAESFFMLDDHSFRTGLWAGIDEDWRFGPFKLNVEAWIEAGASISAKPTQYTGKLWLHGAVGVAIWRFGVDLEVDTYLEAEVFTPYHVLGELKVHIGLPWPLPDINKRVDLEWGPELIVPPLPLPLQAINIEHFKVTTAWPLARGHLLLPNYGSEGFRTDPDVPPAQVAGTPPPSDAPVVPLDCRPRLAFGRSVHDDAFVAVNPLPPQPDYERIGDPVQNQGSMRVRYGLWELALDAWDGVAWQPAARKVGSSHPIQNPSGLPELYGSWAPVSGQTSGGNGATVSNTKLWLWSRTPFDFILHGGGDYADWFVDDQPDYLCPTPPEDRELCVDFENIPLAAQFESPWVRPSAPHLRWEWLGTPPQQLVELETPIDGLTKALQIEPVGFNTSIVISRSCRLRITLPTPAKRITVTLFASDGITAFAVEQGGAVQGPVLGGTPEAPFVSVSGDQLQFIELMSRNAMFVARICYVVGASKADLDLLQEVKDHIQDAMQRWSEPGSILEPHTQYRLKCVTRIDAEPEGELAGIGTLHHEQIEYAYFRTEGPPGLSVLSIPVLEPQPAAFASGLDTLAPYVRYTLPEAAPGVGESPNVPVRPVYRAYDVGVFFNENYVDLMYRADGHDLGLYLYDPNGQRVHVFRGVQLFPEQSWQAALGELNLAEVQWIEVVDASPCVTLDPDTKPADNALHDACAGRVLSPDSTYEARLVPLLFREDFDAFTNGQQADGPAGTLGPWRIVDVGTQQGPSRWRVEEGAAGRYVVQLSNIWGADVQGNDPDKPGSMLLRGDPSWSDYHLHLRMQSLDDDAIGVVFRYLDSNTFYRFSLDRERGYRRLVRVISGVHTVLAEDDFRYETGRVYAVTIEAVGPTLRVRQDGVTVFEATDATLDRGAIGLYCWGNQRARFHSLRAEDLRAAAPVPYRFAFTTSRYANFAHQVHSYQDEVRRVEVADALPAAFDPNNAPIEEENRAYEQLAAALGEAGTPAALDATLISVGGEDRALWLRLSEPLRWERLAFGVQGSTRWARQPAPPGVLKLTGFEAGELTADGERVHLLCRDAFDLTGYAIEARLWPGPIRATPTAAHLLVDEFDRVEAGVVFSERGGPNALDKYLIVGEGTQLGPSLWRSVGDWIEQTSSVFGGTLNPADAAKPGTLARLPGSYGNVRIRCTLRVDLPGAIGLVFRYAAPDRYYRLSFDPDLRYRRLIRRDPQGVSVLWEDGAAVTTGQALRVSVELFDDWLVGYLDEALLFAVRDTGIESGAVGMYAWRCPTAAFRDLRIETLTTNPVAWAKGFNVLGALRIVDAPEAVDDPSDWEVLSGGGLVQRANLRDVPDPSEVNPLLRGTMAVVNNELVEDGVIGLRLRSEANGAIGLVFRYQDEDNFYRFSIRQDVPGRRLTRVVNGVATDLWSDGVGYESGIPYQLMLRLDGSRLIGSLDGAQLFSVNDTSFTAGQIGLYCWANPGVRFERLVALHEPSASGMWSVVDSGDVAAPSQWRTAGGAMQQMSSISSGSHPDALGTHALAGDDAWRDYRVTVELRTDSGGAFGAVFRYRDEDNYYRFSVDAAQPYRRLVKRVHGTTTVLWQDNLTVPVGAPMRLVIDAVGDRLAVHLDDTRLLVSVDADHAQGRVGLYTAQNPSARFERVVVTAPPLSARALFADPFASGSLDGFSAIDTGDQSAPSAWQPHEGTARQRSNIFDLPVDRDTLAKRGTELVVDGHDWHDLVVTCRLQSFDNDAIDVLFRYQDADNSYRFSMDSERQYRRLVKLVGGNAELLWESADGYEVGRAYQLVIVARGAELRVYLDGIAVCRVTDSSLSHGTVALYCWGNDDARFAALRVLTPADLYTAWSVDESFEVAIAERWNLSLGVDADAVERWRLIPGALEHAPGPTGTDFALLNALVVDDCRIAARLEVDGSGRAGLVARFEDANHFYALVLDSGGVRLLRRLGEEEVLLAHADVTLPARPCMLTLTCDGQRLTGHLDGELLVDVDDASLSDGQVGVLCASEATATVSALRMSEPDWLPYHVFSSTRALPAGAPVEVRSGASDGVAVSPAVSGTLLCHVAEGPDPGEVWLGEHSELRLVDPLGQLEQRRAFVPDGVFAPVNASVIRNRDSTACFVLPQDGLAVFAQYRLDLTFRRDNRAQVPESPVLRQAGDASDERVHLDMVRPLRLSTGFGN